VGAEIAVSGEQERLMKKTGLIIGLVAIASVTVANVETLLEQAKDDQGYAPLFAEDLSNALLTENMWQYKGEILLPTPERVTKPLPPKKGKKKPKHPSNLWSVDLYENFIIDLEFKCATNTNSGVIIRCSDIPDWVQNALEVQVLQPGAKAKTSKNEIGAVYDCKATDKKPVLSPLGEWNHYTVIAKDNWIHVVLNGELINSMDLDLWTEVGKNPDGSKNKYKAAVKDRARKGHVGLQSHGQPIWYRNVRIKTL
jgi:hypothetical protein